MPIAFGDQTGNLFNRIGRLGKAISELDAYQAAQLINFTDETDGVTGQYNEESDIQAVMGSSYISLLNNAGGGMPSILSQMASQTFGRVVFRDEALYNQTLTQFAPLESVIEVIRQMEQEGATVLAMTVTATPTLFSLYSVNNTGNGCIVASVKRALDGRTLENTFAEEITFICTSDSYSGPATAGNEGFTITGQGAQTNFFAFDWPLGSNCAITTNAIDGNASNSSGNLLNNSGFIEWTANVPDNWTLDVGVAGTDISEETGIVFGAASCLKITGDGATYTQLSQEFNSGSGTSSTLEDLNQYASNLWLRRDGIAAAAGELTVELVNDGDVVINDEAGVPNSFTIDLTALTVEFANYGQAFRTPQIMPETYYFRIRLSTPLTSGRSVYVACTALGEQNQLYVSGPYISLFAGSEPFARGDITTMTTTNSRGAAGTLDTFQTLCARLMPGLMYSNELLLPSSSTPSVSDLLITR